MSVLTADSTGCWKHEQQAKGINIIRYPDAILHRLAVTDNVPAKNPFCLIMQLREMGRQLGSDSSAGGGRQGGSALYYATPPAQTVPGLFLRPFPCFGVEIR